MRFVSLLLAALAAGCASTSDYFREAGPPPPAEPRALEHWPWRELWNGVVFNGGRIGFTRLRLQRAADAEARWDIEAEAAVRLRFLGVDKRVNLRSRERVRADLTLERFAYSYELDGSPLEVSGHSDGVSVHLKVAASGSKDEKRLPIEAPLYPQSALGMLPVMKGLAVGRSDRFLVLQGQTQSLAEATQAIAAYERSSLFEGPAFRVETELLGVRTTTWIAPDGRPLLELALRGTMISALETEEEAKRYLVAASLAKDEALAQFALLKTAPLEDARRLSRMEIELSGVPSALAVPSGNGQSCRRESDRVRCVVDRDAQVPSEEGEPERYLRPSLAVPSNEGEIAALARSIAGEAREPEELTRRILAWLEANIAREAVDVFTAADVLRERRAECQGHAYLFAALARSLGIPTRVANGLVYSEPHGGFLYHTWNEIRLEGRGWRPVDPIFGQLIADATHLKLVEGESLLELAPLAGMVGNARVESVRALARW